MLELVSNVRLRRINLWMILWLLDGTKPWFDRQKLLTLSDLFLFELEEVGVWSFFFAVDAFFDFSIVLVDGISP